jgi:hypothetical protein
MALKSIPGLVITISAVLILSVSSLAHAGYKMGDIEWGDSPETVISKARAAGWGEANIPIDSNSKKPRIVPLSRIIENHVDREMRERLHSLVNKTGTDVDIANPRNILYLYTVELEGHAKSPIKNATFFFDLDRKLLAYKVLTREPCTEQEKDDRIGLQAGQPVPKSYSFMYRTLEQKYGPPTQSIRLFVQWKADNELMYYSCSVPNVQMYYINQMMVDGFIAKVQGGATRDAAASNQDKAKVIADELAPTGLGYGALSWDDTLATYQAALEKSAPAGGPRLKVSYPTAEIRSVRLGMTIPDRGIVGDDEKKLWRRDVPDTSGVKDRALVNSDSYKTVELEGENGSHVSKAFLFFSEITGKLVVYRLQLTDRCTEKEKDDISNRFFKQSLPKGCEYSYIYNTLAKMLGGDGILASSKSVKWEKGGETIYYVCYGSGNPSMLVFVNMAGISDHYETFKTRVQQNLDKAEPQKAQELKKTF